MTAVRQLDFDQVCDLLVAIDGHNTPSEVHGYLVGQLAAGRRMTESEWLQEAREVIDTEVELSAEHIEQLQYFYIVTLAALGDEQLSFEPLLPPDEEHLDERLECLAYWCMGFLAGFALVEKTIAELSEPVNDALSDLAAISQVGGNDEEEFNASADEDYMQLVEYIRLAVMNIFLEYAKPSEAVAQKQKEEDAPRLTAQSLFTGRKLH